MSATNTTNMAWTLAVRPQGEPDEKTFSLTEKAVPVPGDSQMLLRTVYLSLDPYMRGRLASGKSYAAPVAIGDVMVGGTVSQVEQSNIEGFEPGDWVLSQGGWQKYSLAGKEGVIKLAADFNHPSYALGVLGMPGFTAYMGLAEIGQPRPGDTLVVAAATGPVGSAVGQLGKIWGCKVVGVAGGEEKCRYAAKTLGFDACLDHRAADFEQQLAEACPDGIDIYFENVGGRVFDAVFPLLNTGARVPLCGLVSSYNATSLPDGPDRTSYILMEMIKRRIQMRGFIIFDDFGDRYGEFFEKMGKLVAEGKIHYKEQIVEGLEKAPAALNQLLRGENFGKMVIKVSDAR